MAVGLRRALEALEEELAGCEILLRKGLEMKWSLESGELPVGKPQWWE